MKRYKYCMLSIVLLALVWAAGCDNGGGPTGPANAPILSNIIATNPVHAGEAVVFEIDFVDVNGDLHGGFSIITDDRGNNYDPVLISAEGTEGRFSIIITLSVMLAPGDITFYVSVQDVAENQSNMLPVTISIAQAKTRHKSLYWGDAEIR